MSIRTVLEKRAETIGEKPFLYFRDQMINFATLNHNVNKAANLLSELGVEKGDHVCLFLPNCPEFIYLWFGLAKLGGVMVPLNVNLRGEGLAYIVNHCDAQRIVVHDRLYDAFKFVEGGLKGIRERICLNENAVAPENFLSLNELMASADPTAPPEIHIHDGDPLGIIYTSGTTGPPKGAIISQFNYMNSGRVWAEDIIEFREDDIFFTTLPLFHANAQMFTTMGALYSGRPFVLRERFSASKFFDDIRRYGATIFNYIGGMLTMLMKQPERKDDARNPARATFGGAAPKEIWPDFEKRFNTTIIEGFGLTESGGVCLCNPPHDIKLGSIGKPMKFCDVAIWDENNQEVPIGESGEIVGAAENTPQHVFGILQTARQNR